MMTMYSFDRQFSKKELDIIISHAKNVSICSLYNFNTSTNRLEDLRSKVAYFEIPIDTSHNRDDVMEQISYVISRKLNDSTLRQLDNSFINKSRSQDVDRIFSNFCDRVISIIGQHVFIYLADCQEIRTLGNRFISFVRKMEQISSVPNIHYILICNCKNHALANNNYFRLSEELDINKLIYMDNMNKVYISHIWTGASQTCSVQLIDSLKQRGIPFSIDQQDCRYLDNIRDYENELTSASVVIPVIDSGYLKSLNAMGELSAIFEGDRQANIFPLLAEGRDVINNAKIQKELTEYWKEKIDNSNSGMESHSSNENKIYAQNRTVIERIITQLPDIFMYFSDNNIPPASDLLSNNNIEAFFAKVSDCLGIKTTSDNSIDSSIVPVENNYNAEKINVFNGPVSIKDLNM